MIDVYGNGIEEFMAKKENLERYALAGNDLPETWRLKTWDVNFQYSYFKNYNYEKAFVHPIVSKTQNIGCDGSGVHFTTKTDSEYVKNFNENDEKMDFNFYNGKMVDSQIRVFFTDTFETKLTKDL